MFQQGYINTTNVDISEIVIEQMKQEAQKLKINLGENCPMKFLALDATDM